MTRYENLKPTLSHILILTIICYKESILGFRKESWLKVFELEKSLHIEQLSTKTCPGKLTVHPMQKK